MSQSLYKEGESEALPPTFGNLKIDSRQVSKRKQGDEGDVDMENMEQPKKKFEDEDIYGHSDNEPNDDNQPIVDDEEPQVLNPSKAKFDKFLEDIRLREIQISGTFGDGQNTFNFGGSVFKVDPYCKL